MESCWDAKTHGPCNAAKVHAAQFDVAPEARRASDVAVDIPASEAHRKPGPGWCKFERELSYLPSADDNNGFIQFELQSGLLPPSGWSTWPADRRRTNTFKPPSAYSTELPEVVQELLKRSSANTEVMMKDYDEKLRELRDEIAQLKQAYEQLLESGPTALKRELAVMRQDLEAGLSRHAADLLRSDALSHCLSAMRQDLDEVRVLALSLGRATAVPSGQGVEWDTHSPLAGAWVTGPLAPMPPAPPPSGAMDFFMEFDRTQGMLGLDLDPSDGTSLLIAGIHEGLLQEWNDLHPQEAIMPGDRVVAVDGCGGDAPFLLAGARRLGRVKLTVRRYAKNGQEPRVSAP